jgi:hypothetical protein
MSDFEPEINFQCYICPYCFDDHTSNICKTSDVKEHTEKLRAQLAEAREVIEKVAKPIEKTVYHYGAMSDRNDPPYPVTETVDKDDAKEARAFLAKYPKGDT